MELREKSLDWWRALSDTTRKYLEEKYHPHQNYVTYKNIYDMYMELIQPFVK